LYYIHNLNNPKSGKHKKTRVTQMSQSENMKKNYSEPELKAHGKISGLTQQVGGSGGFGTTAVFIPTDEPTATSPF
jgi:hypothetical protein